MFIIRKLPSTPHDSHESCTNNSGEINETKNSCDETNVETVDEQNIDDTTSSKKRKCMGSDTSHSSDLNATLGKKDVKRSKDCLIDGMVFLNLLIRIKIVNKYNILEP